MNVETGAPVREDFVFFTVAATRFAVRADAVVGVVDGSCVLGATELPRNMLGYVKRNDELVPVMDLRGRLGLADSERAAVARRLVLLLDTESMPFPILGIAAEDAEHVADVEGFLGPLRGPAKPSAPGVRNVLLRDGELSLVVTASLLVDPDERIDLVRAVARRMLLDPNACQEADGDH